MYLHAMWNPLKNTTRSIYQGIPLLRVTSSDPPVGVFSVPLSASRLPSRGMALVSSSRACPQPGRRNETARAATATVAAPPTAAAVAAGSGSAEDRPAVRTGLPGRRAAFRPYVRGD